MLASPAFAARVAVLANNGLHPVAFEVASDFNAKLAGHTFTGIDAGAATPTLDSLIASYDAILLFENLTFSNAPNIGAVVAAFADTGRPVLLGSFYDQDRSDAPTINNTPPHGWGALETIDPNTTDGVGTPYAARTLNTAGIVGSPLTAGVTSLFATASTGFAGGNQAKPGTTVLATWTQNNANGLPDPAIAYRITAQACVIHIAIFPDYPAFGTFGTDFGGDFYRVWQNAFDFAGNACKPTQALVNTIPTLGIWSIAALSGLLLLVAAASRRRLAHRILR